MFEFPLHGRMLQTLTVITVLSKLLYRMTVLGYIEELIALSIEAGRDALVTVIFIVHISLLLCCLIHSNR